MSGEVLALNTGEWHWHRWGGCISNVGNHVTGI